MKKIIIILTIFCFSITLGFSQQKQLKEDIKTALIIIDIQNDYFDKGTMTLDSADKASENARLILDKFRADSLIIIHIQHIATKPTSTFFLPNIVIIKHYPNSFRETELLDYLRTKKIKNLVICGMMTHMCVDATTRAAIVIGDACATKDLEINGQKVKAEDVQKSFLASLDSFYATVKTTKQYLDEK